MCYKVTCGTCGKTTWGGCGMHVDSVMKDVKEEDRCKCKENKAAAGGAGGGWSGAVRDYLGL